MFRILIPITKKTKGADGKVRISGVASDPSIDRDNERFSSEAVSKMVERVNNANIPIRLEHEDKVYTEVGVWKSASLGDDMKMYVEGELDTDLSLGRDIAVLLDRGVPMSLSVGGSVLKTGYEYVKDLGKNIRVYLDVILEEISITKNPSNYNASLSLAKSVNWESTEKVGQVRASTEAEKMVKHYRDLKPASSTEFEECLRKSFKDKMESGTVQKFWSEIFDNGLAPIIKNNKITSNNTVQKDYYDDMPCETGYDKPQGLTATDLATIVMITKFLSDVTIPVDAEMPSEFMDYAFMNALPEECYVILDHRVPVLPHHNPQDLSVNKAFLAYCLKCLFDKYSYWTPKEYNAILPHLYRHVVDTANSETVAMSKDEAKKSEAAGSKQSQNSMFDENQMALLKAASEHYTKSPNMPFLYEGQEVTPTDVNKMAAVYAAILKANAQAEAPVKKTEGETPEAPVTEPAPEVTTPENSEEEVEKGKTKVKTVPGQTDADKAGKRDKVGKTEEEIAAEEEVEKKKKKEEKEKEDMKEDDAEKSKKKNCNADGEEMMTEKEWKERMKAMEEEKSKKPKAKKSETEEEPAEVAGEDAVTEDEVPSEEGVTKSVLGFEKTVGAKLENFSKSIEEMQTVTKTLSEKLSQVDDFAKSLEAITQIVDKLADATAVRKSHAVASFNTIEKSGSNEVTTEVKDIGQLIAKFMDADKGLSAQDAYKKAKIAMSNPS